MKLIADEGVDKPIVDALRNHGFDVLYILEDYRSADDDFIPALSDSLNAVLLTQDKDFGELVFRLKRAHFGVVLIRLQGYTPEAKGFYSIISFASTSGQFDTSIYCNTN